MNKHSILFIIVFLYSCLLHAQTTHRIEDSIRKGLNIPELGYAVVSSDSVLDIYIGGVRKAGTNLAASLTDRFRIGSNTKAVTCYLAAMLVKERKIAWNTRFFDIFPELKTTSNPAYYNLTLLDLLTFRTHLFAWTYTNNTPAKEQFWGSDSVQRYQFARWFFASKPVRRNDTICFSNLGYVAAGLMMEKVSGKSYEDLVRQLGRSIDTDYGFGQPNSKSELQTWGHNEQLEPEAPTDNYKLSWLLAAGNINATVPGHAHFLQLLLKGLLGRQTLLSADETKYLFQARPQFTLGWFTGVDVAGNPYYVNTGNPGTFLSRIIIFPTYDRAILIFTNVQSADADQGIDLLMTKLQEKWVNNL